MVSEKIVNNSLLSAQKRSWDIFVRISSSKNIGNAYLISGPKGSGKEGLAIKFAQLLNCSSSDIEICYTCESCIRFKNLQHEKLNIIVPLPAPKNNKTDDNSNYYIPDDYIDAIKKKSLDPFYKITIPKANRILINSIRGLRKTLYFNQDENNGRNIVIIFDSELLCFGQGESGNALLKVLEEPPNHTTLILVTDYKKMLFQTIVSRCQTINIPGLPNDFVFDWLMNRNIEKKDANLLVSISRGNLHQARSLSEHPVNTIINIIEKLSNTLINNNPQKWRSFTDYYSRLSGSDQQKFIYHLNLISLWFKSVLLNRQGLNSDFDNTTLHPQIVSFNQNYPRANVYEIILSIEDVMRSISQNLYMPLILINLILDIQKHLDE